MCKRKLFTLLYAVIVRSLRLVVLVTVFILDDFAERNIFVVKNI